MGSLLSIGVTTAILSLVYESISLAIDHHTNKRAADGYSYHASPRARTLLPMLRNTIFILFATALTLMALSEVGLDIRPLLAGAGILGVAVGFGSQTLIKDFLTGLFIVTENTIAIGDIIRIGDLSGVVEAMTIRTLRLRDVDGAQHILPFSEVTKITNMSKGFAYAYVKVGVSYNTDLEQAMKVMEEVCVDLRRHPKVGHYVIEPMEMLGVESLGDYSITLSARIRTSPGLQWDVKRVYLLLLKKRFDFEKIDLPYPTSVHLNKQLPEV